MAEREDDDGGGGLNRVADDEINLQFNTKKKSRID